MPKARRKRTRVNARADIGKGNTEVENGAISMTDVDTKGKMLEEMASEMAPPKEERCVTRHRTAARETTSK